MTETKPNPFSVARSAATIETVAEAMRERNFQVELVQTAAEAKAAALALIPEGAEVHSGKSKTLEDAGIFSELRDSGRYDFLRTKMFAMDRQTQAREIRKLIAAPAICSAA